MSTLTKISKSPKKPQTLQEYFDNWKLGEKIFYRPILRKECANVALVYTRGSNTAQTIFCSRTMVDNHLMGQNSMCVPMLLYEKDFLGNTKITYNYDRDPKSNPFKKRYGEDINLKDIWGYYYSILHHKPYIQRYFYFLTKDVPYVPFVTSRSQFLELSRLGNEYIELHLEDQDSLAPLPPQSPPVFTTDAPLIIKKPRYDPDTQRLYLTPDVYYPEVTQEMWDYCIGEYPLLKKYLGSHQDDLDLQRFSTILKITRASCDLDTKISQINLETTSLLT